jgi:hypothetical protein
LSRKLNRGQKQTPFRLSASTKASSSKAEGTHRTQTEETFLTAFFNFFATHLGKTRSRLKLCIRSSFGSLAFTLRRF